MNEDLLQRLLHTHKKGSTYPAVNGVAEPGL